MLVNDGNHQLTYGSVCSGIEAASIAWEPLGLKPAWFAEIEKFPSAVLAHHWPHVRNLGDMTKIAAAIRAGTVDAPDILVGGTPCQAFSIAGMRKGLGDQRGQLTLAFIELANAIDDVRRAAGKPPCIIIWENVQGVLNMPDNAFGNFISGLAGADEAIEPGSRPNAGKNSKFWRWKKNAGHHVAKWPHAGCAYGVQRAAAWRLLNAEHFGVAQRRRRVFVIASARKGFDPFKILAEFDGVRRDSAPCREPGAVAASLTKNGVGVAGADDNQAQAGHLIPTAFVGGNTSGARSVSTCLTTKNQRLDFDTETLNAISSPESGLAVRRLMPVECERLQGLPEGHTEVACRQKIPLDGPRYKAIGNSMAVPIMRWVMARIQQSLKPQETVAHPPAKKPARKGKKRDATAGKATVIHQRPFLKWSGGKYSQLDQILPLIGTGNRLIEPFVGAGSVFMNATGFDKYILGDTSKDLIALYHALQQNTKGLVDTARVMFDDLNSQEEYEKVCAKFNGVDHTPLWRAAAFLYLNRHCFNGLMRYNLSGKYNVGFGRYKSPYFPVNELEAFVTLSQSSTFINQSFVDTIRLAGPGDVVFCDPPYMPLPGKNGFTSYTTTPFKKEHQWQLINEMVAASQRGARVIVTNSANPELIKAYKEAGFKVDNLYARRSMSCKGATREKVADIIAYI